MKGRIYSKVIEGQISDNAYVELAAELSYHDGKEIEIRIQRRRKRRSLSQNAFMHGGFIPAMQAMYLEFGMDYSDDMVKSIFKKQFGFSEVVELPGGTKEIIQKSTADYTTIECEQAMDRARQYYSEFYQLPYPHQIGYEIQE